MYATAGDAMRRAFVTLLVVAWLSITGGQVVFANSSLTPRQNEILQTVMNANGYLTKELHTELWASLPRSIVGNPKERDAFVRVIDRALIVSMRFQREGWASMRDSIDAKKISKTDDYEAAKRAIMDIAIPSNQAQLQAAVKNMEGMIAAAASGSVFQTPKGPMYVTSEMTTQVLGGLDASLSRLRRLLSVTWAPQAVEHRYLDAHVAVLSPDPFNVEYTTEKVENGRILKTVHLTQQLSSSEHIGIAFAHIGAVWKDSQSGILASARGAIRKSGATQNGPITTAQWRGRLSATIGGSTNSSGGLFFLSGRVVEMRSVAGILIFSVVSAVSQIEADTLRAEIEQSTQMID